MLLLQSSSMMMIRSTLFSSESNPISWVNWLVDTDVVADCIGKLDIVTWSAHMSCFISFLSSFLWWCCFDNFSFSFCNFSLDLLILFAWMDVLMTFGLWIFCCLFQQCSWYFYNQRYHDLWCDGASILPYNISESARGSSPTQSLPACWWFCWSCSTSFCRDPLWLAQHCWFFFPCTLWCHVWNCMHQDTELPYHERHPMFQLWSICLLLGSLFWCSVEFIGLLALEKCGDRDRPIESLLWRALHHRPGMPRRWAWIFGGSFRWIPPAVSCGYSFWLLDWVFPSQLFN